MWVLLGPNDLTFTLLTGKEHLISRRDGDLVLADDQSISRKHAVISVEYDMKNLVDPAKLPVVTVIDTNSKYGIFINDGIEKSIKMGNGSRQVLRDGDQIRFGLQWNVWRLEHRPLVVTTSTLTPTEKKNLKQAILKLGGHMVGNWREDVTHVTMNNLTLTVKVVCALALGRHIVTPQYWECYVTSLSSKQPVPECKNFIPPLAEASLNMNEVSFEINEKRKTLFSGKTFVFSSEHQFKNYSCMVSAAGGRPCMLSDFENKKENLLDSDIIVMQYSLPRHSQDSQIPDSFQEVASFLKGRGRRVIPESEIGLAILHCSMVKNCNPLLRVTSTLLSNESREINSQRQVILALDTQVSENASLKMEERIIIPESGVVPKQKSSSSEGETVQKHKKLKTAESGGLPEKDTVIIPESGSLPKERFSMTGGNDQLSETSYSRTDLSESNTVPVKDETSGFLAGRIKRERLSTTDDVDATLDPPQKRLRSFESNGFLTKSCKQSTISKIVEKSPVKVEVKVESDDEDLFKFPSDTSVKPAKDDSDEDEDMFAFTDEPEIIKQNLPAPEKSLAPAESSKKRKGFNDEIEQPSKRPALEKPDLISQDKNSGTQISRDGFISAVSEKKDNTSLNDTMTSLTERVKNVTVVEYKPLISQKFNTEISEPSYSKYNFKKFTKVRAAPKNPLIRNKDLVPFEVDTKGLSNWLNETHTENCVQNDDEDDDWAFVQTSEVVKNKNRTRRI